MRISLILLNYNDYKTTIKYIEFVKAYEIIKNIIVVDNCSTNNSFTELKKYESDKICVIRTDKNGGYAYGNNFGVKFAKKNFKPEYIIISNPDVYFKEEIIELMIKEIERYDNIAIIAPRMINNENTNEARAWKLPTYWMNCCKLSITFSKVFFRYLNYSDKYFNDDITYVDVIPGSFFMIKTKTFYEIGLFDENTFLYGEENILAYKIKQHGYRNVILNTCSFNHEHSVSINKSFSSYEEKYKILFKSLDYYNTAYLNTGKIKGVFFLMWFKITNLEKKIIALIKNNI